MEYGKARKIITKNVDFLFIIIIFFSLVKEHGELTELPENELLEYCRKLYAFDRPKLLPPLSSSRKRIVLNFIFASSLTPLIFCQVTQHFLSYPIIENFERPRAKKIYNKIHGKSFDVIRVAKKPGHPIQRKI